MVERLAYDLETDLIILIAKYLGEGWGEKAGWKIRKLKDLGAFTEESRVVINRYRVQLLSGTDKDMQKHIQDFISAMRRSVHPSLAREVKLSDGMKSILTAWSNQAKDQVNISLSRLAQSAGQSYVHAVSKASMGVLTGAQTHDEALETAIGQLESLEAFVDRAGRTWTPEGYISTVIRSNSGRAVKEMQMELADEMDTDLVEVSAHAGARPKCFPYQGKILSLSGKTSGYMTLDQTSYGEPDGLLGINCGHILIPFVEGLSKEAQKLDVSEKENDRIYKESQEQRRLEREIRYAKRNEAKFRAGGISEKAGAWGQRVKEKQANMETFIKETGRTRRTGREKVYT